MALIVLVALAAALACRAWAQERNIGFFNAPSTAFASLANAGPFSVSIGGLRSVGDEQYATECSVYSTASGVVQRSSLECPLVARGCGFGYFRGPQYDGEESGAPSVASAVFLSFGGSTLGAPATASFVAVSGQPLAASTISPPASSPTAPQWPSARASHACSNLVQTPGVAGLLSRFAVVYVSGGVSASGELLSDVWQLSVDTWASSPTITWQLRSSTSPLSRRGHAIAAHDSSTLVAAGGFSTVPSGAAVGDVFLSHDSGASWTPIASLATPRANFGLLFSDLGMFAVAGDSGPGAAPLANLEYSFDVGATWTALELPNYAPRRGASYFFPDTDAVVVGGLFSVASPDSDGSASVPVGDAYIAPLDGISPGSSIGNTTSSLAPGVDRWLPATVPIASDAIMSIGGRRGYATFADYAILINGPQSVAMAPMPMPEGFSPRYGASAAASGASVLLVGGCSVNAATGVPAPISDVWTATLTGIVPTWRRVADQLPFAPHCGAPLVAIESKFFYVGAGADANEVHYTQDSGATWTSVTSLPASAEGASAAYLADSDVFAVVGGAGGNLLMTSTNMGITWRSFSAAAGWPHARFASVAPMGSTNLLVVGGYRADGPLVATRQYGVLNMTVADSPVFTSRGVVGASPPRGGAGVVAALDAAFFVGGEAYDVLYTTLPSIYFTAMCSPGYSGASGFCSECPANMFSTGGMDGCQVCAAGEAAPPGSSSCLPCPSPLSPSEVGMCTCPAGQSVSSLGSFALTCAPCPPNTFADNSTFGLCAPCPPGSESGLSSSSCTPCGAGAFAVPGSSCGQCPAGTFSNGNVPCQPCAPGSFSPASGSSTCGQCPAGTFSDGTRACESCSAGSYSTASSGRCLRCPAGFFSASGAGTCSPCGRNQTSAAGAASCTPCGANQESLNGAVCVCRAGYLPTGQSGACQLPCVAPATYDAATDRCITPGGGQPRCRAGAEFISLARSCVCTASFEAVGELCVARCNSTSQVRNVVTGECDCASGLVFDGAACLPVPPEISSLPVRGTEPAAVASLQLGTTATTVAQFVQEQWPVVQGYVLNVTLAAIRDRVSRIVLNSVRLSQASRRRLLDAAATVSVDFTVVFLESVPIASVSTLASSVGSSLQDSSFASGVAQQVQGLVVVSASAAPQPAVCSNGVRDVTESDVDCGGVACAACTVGKSCLRGEDCSATLSCTENVCTAAAATKKSLLALYIAAPIGLIVIAIASYACYWFMCRKAPTPPTASSDTLHGTKNILAGHIDYEMTASRAGGMRTTGGY